MFHRMIKHFLEFCSKGAFQFSVKFSVISHYQVTAESLIVTKKHADLPLLSVT